MRDVVVEVDEVSMQYGAVTAVRSMSLEVWQGETLAVVGPNGAGKSSLIEVMEGLRRPSSGRIRVLGVDPFLRRNWLAERMGVQLQGGGINPRLRVCEVVELFRSLYRRPRSALAVLTEAGLTEQARDQVGHMSGGQRQRLALALALINDPELVFLDELTTGLDPHARREMWSLIASLKARGRTVVFVTHYMDEAQSLADRVAVVCKGRIQAVDDPDALTGRLAPGHRVVVNPWPERGLDKVVSGVYRLHRNRDRACLYTTALAATVAGIERILGPGVTVRAEQTDLEDAYLTLVEERG